MQIAKRMDPLKGVLVMEMNMRLARMKAEGQDESLSPIRWKNWRKRSGACRDLCPNRERIVWENVKKGWGGEKR